MHVDHRQPQRNPEIELGGLGDARGAADHDCDIVTGATHVAGDHMAKTGTAGERCSRHHARGRAGSHDAGSTCVQLLQRRQTAIRLHDEGWRDVFPLGEPLLETAGIARDKWLQIALHDGGAGALELVVFAHDTRRRDDLPGRVYFVEDDGGPFLVRRVGVGVEVGDHDRLDALAAKGLGQCADVGLVKWLDDRPLVVDALGDLPPHIARDQGLVRAGEAIHLLSVAAPEFQNVAKSLRRDERTARALALDHRVGRDRGAVQDDGELLRFDAGSRQCIDEALARIPRRRQNLDDAIDVGAVARECQIRERAPDVDANHARHAISPLLQLLSRRPRFTTLPLPQVLGP